jgi:hypothetical protein
MNHRTTLALRLAAGVALCLTTVGLAAARSDASVIAPKASVIAPKYGSAVRVALVTAAVHVRANQPSAGSTAGEQLASHAGGGRLTYR